MFRNIARLAGLALILCLLAPVSAMAHKVTVFAYVDGKNVVVDAFYSRSNKVNGGKLTVLNAATGEEYQRLTTDAEGAASFPVPQKAIAAKADLRILLVAGEGHQDETVVRASEFATLTAAAPAKASAPASAPVSAKTQAKAEAKAAAKAGGAPSASPAPSTASAAAAPATATMDEAALTRIVTQAVDQAVESRMAPVKRLLVSQAEKGPGVSEIAGGIGYIVGLFGVAAFVASRKKDKSAK